ncbi:MAG: hypothetical protein ABI692_16405 [Terracoccus sp.]
MTSTPPGPAAGRQALAMASASSPVRRAGRPDTEPFGPNGHDDDEEWLERLVDPGLQAACRRRVWPG